MRISHPGKVAFVKPVHLLIDTKKSFLRGIFRRFAIRKEPPAREEDLSAMPFKELSEAGLVTGFYEAPNERRVRYLGRSLRPTRHNVCG